MALQAMWVHGTGFRSEWVGDNLLKVPGTRHDGSNGDVNWSDVNGLPRGWGATFRGRNGVADLVDGVTRFNLPAAREVFFGLALSVGVYFQEDGNITFCTAGADFDV